jgi:hypothetical protein
VEVEDRRVPTAAATQYDTTCTLPSLIPPETGNAVHAFHYTQTTVLS